ncbi:MAG: phosphatidate cytidylyltransferase [Thermoplasmatales archaeon]|nr:phosphatidate cytidylyltransferase [Thermoplasmatales archaeon]
MDLIGLVAVYLYVFILIILSEKVLSRYPVLSRKILHIMVGNILFILPFFENRYIMAFLAAAPFIPLTFLMSPYSPLKIKSKASSAGHGLGLVYYSISWTLLAYVFFNDKFLIAIGIVAMSYGDGFASLFGTKFGRRKYKIFGDEKSIEGSLSMFFAIIFFGAIAMLYYNFFEGIQSILLLIFISFFATVVEGITPKGLDNLTVSLTASILCYGIKCAL